jgi:hypothetical protein
MRQSISLASLTIVLSMASAGCGAQTAGRSAIPAVPAQESPMPSIVTLSELTEKVLADAAKRSGMDKASLKVESAEAVTWSDGSLGCPEPGMMYTQALVPGYRVKVRAGEELLDYRAGSRGYFVVCLGGKSVEPVAPSDRQ